MAFGCDYDVIIDKTRLNFYGFDRKCAILPSITIGFKRTYMPPIAKQYIDEYIVFKPQLSASEKLVMRMRSIVLDL